MPSGAGWLGQWVEGLLIDRENGHTELTGYLGPGFDYELEPVNFLNGVPVDWRQPSDGTFAEVFRQARLVHDHGACSLPGININYHAFIAVLEHATDRGWVSPMHARYVARMLRWGCDLGASVSELRGARIFRNYETATGQFEQQVVDAVDARVSSGKSLDLGEWLGASSRSLLLDTFSHYFIAPMAAREKPLEPGVCRPLTDHTRTGFNKACTLGILSHSLDTYDEIAREHKRGFMMTVSDVANAFPIMAIMPHLWPYMMTRCARIIRGHGPRVGMLTKLLHLIMPVAGDFGTRGMPGSFFLFYTKCLIPMARSLSIISRPMPTWVDDSALIGASGQMLLREMTNLQAWASTVLGVTYKWLKDKPPAQVQHMLGYWWDSFERTCTLDDTRLGRYMAELLDFSTRRTLSLSERQVVAGRMQSAVRTMPPGAACLLANTYAMMEGLRLPWARRRTRARERSDYRFFHDVLGLNLGRGFFSTDAFTEGPTVLSDASKCGGADGYCGGGWCSADGRYDYYKYGSKSKRQPIDFLEGDTVVAAVEALMGHWRGKWIAFGIDNSAFELSAEKGRSRAERLNVLCKRLFVLQIQGNFILRYFWLGTHENYLADHLSRGRVREFLLEVAGSGFLLAGVILTAPRDGGRTRTFDNLDPFQLFGTLTVAALACARGTRRNRNMLLYSRQVKAAVQLQAAARGRLVRARAAADAALFALAHPQADVNETTPVEVTTAAPTPTGMRARRQVTPYGSVRFFFYLFSCCCDVTYAAGVCPDCNALVEGCARLAPEPVCLGPGTERGLVERFSTPVTELLKGFVEDELRGISRRQTKLPSPNVERDNKLFFSLLVLLCLCFAVCRRDDCPPAQTPVGSPASSDAVSSGSTIDYRFSPHSHRGGGISDAIAAEAGDSSDDMQVSVDEDSDEAVEHFDDTMDPLVTQWHVELSHPHDGSAEAAAQRDEEAARQWHAAHAPRGNRVPPRGFRWKNTQFIQPPDGPARDNLHSTPRASGRPRSSPPPVRSTTRHSAGKGGGGMRSQLFVVCCLGMLGSADATGRGAGLSRLDASVQYARTSIYNGMRSDYCERLDRLLDNRLAPSSMRTVERAVELWKEVAANMGYDYIIETDDECRGAKCATFIMYMMDHYTELTYDSISNYFWGMRWWMKLQRQADPVLGVMNWGEFMSSVKILTWVPSEPRRQVPLNKLRLLLEAVDTNVFWEVQCAFFLVLVMFLYSRSEYGCPKHHTGEESLDPNRHWLVRDIIIRMTNYGYALMARCKGNKTDRRIERPTARGDGSNPGGAQLGGNDWATVGDVPGIFSVFTWYRRLMTFYTGPRPPTDPFFMAKDRKRAYTYTAAMSDFHALLARVSDDIAYGLHGLRVLGYNLSLSTNGEAITVAHGGWESSAHHRYHRFHMLSVLAIAANMVGGENIYKEAPAPRGVVRSLLERGNAPTDTNPPPRVEPNPWERDSDSEDEPGVPVTDRLTRGHAAVAPAATAAVPARPLVVGTVVSPPRTRGGRGRAPAAAASSSSSA